MTEIEMHIDTLEKLIPEIEMGMNLFSYDRSALKAALQALRRTAEHDKEMEEGRLVELPCKKGAQLFVITPTSTTVIEETKCNRVSIDGSGVAHLFARCVYDTWGGAYYEFKTPDFGKTVFLTRKEAEAALHGGGEGG